MRNMARSGRDIDAAGRSINHEKPAANQLTVPIAFTVVTISTSTASGQLHSGSNTLPVEPNRMSKRT